MAICCCSLAGTAACQHCRNNPFATNVWTNKTVIVDRVEARPFGDGLDVCPVCGKPSTIGKPLTNADRIRAMSDEALAEWILRNPTIGYFPVCPPGTKYEGGCPTAPCEQCWINWLKSPANKEDGE